VLEMTSALFAMWSSSWFFSQCLLETLCALKLHFIAAVTAAIFKELVQQSWAWWVGEGDVFTWFVKLLGIQLSKAIGVWQHHVLVCLVDVWVWLDHFWRWSAYPQSSTPLLVSN
jgi:hypothetical protein